MLYSVECVHSHDDDKITHNENNNIIVLLVLIKQDTEKYKYFIEQQSMEVNDTLWEQHNDIMYLVVTKTNK